MKVMNVNSNISFSRALTTKEKKEYSNTLELARTQLGLDKTTVTIFDFSVPKSKNDTGIGTTFSYDAQELAAFLKTMCGVNSIQLQPQGQISNYITSPYSGSNFSLGIHTIDLNKLSEEKYGKLLKDTEYESPYFSRTQTDKKVDYDNVFSQDGQKAILKKAFKNFQKLDESSDLKKEFAQFRKDSVYWLEKDALYEAAAVANGTEDMTQWSDRDKNVYATKEGDFERIKQLKQVTDEDGVNVVDFEEFVQFIADKQQKESKADFNNQGIDVYGDCLIGFSQKDFWAHRPAFTPNYEFGCDIGDGKFSCWSPAINFYRIHDEAGLLLYNKFNTYFKRYDGVRIDAAWQLINPTICEPVKENGVDAYDSHGNKLGKKIVPQPTVPDNGKYIINDIILRAAADNGVSPDNIFLELLGGNSYESLDSVKGTNTTLIHTSRYAKNDWGRVKYYESKGDNKYQNMQPGQYTIGPGTHDDISLIEQVEIGKERAQYLAKDLNLPQTDLENNPEKLYNAMWAELFTTKNQYATLPDILGSERRINKPNTTADNWTYRAGNNYEEEYYQNLAKGRGLNAADAYSKALKLKQNGKSELSDKLDYYADILKQDGPMTTKEADKLFA